MIVSLKFVLSVIVSESTSLNNTPIVLSSLKAYPFFLIQHTLHSMETYFDSLWANCIHPLLLLSTSYLE